MPSFLESNLDALRRRNPDLADKIRALDSRLPPYLELVPTKTPLAAVRYHSLGGEAPRALCSLYDPMREAQRWAENDPVSSPINLIFLGIGLGYHLMAYLDRFGRFAKSVALVEFDPYLFRLALTALDLRRVMDSESCHCFVAERPEDFPDLLAPLRTKFMVHNFKVLHHRPAQQLQSDYYIKVARQIVEVATFDGVNTKTVLGQRQRNQHNILRNLGAFWRGRMPAEYRDAARGLPAFIIAAGPSLDRNIDELHRIGSRGLLIAVDTSQNTLARHNIQPHFVAVADPTELNFSHFDKVSDLRDIILAFHPESYFGITRKFRDHPYLFPLVDEQGAFMRHLQEALKDSLGEVGHVTRGMNVGQIAFNIAVHLGCDPIILVGMDFAFSPKGGTTHAEDAAVSRTTSVVGEDGYMMVGAKEGKAGAESGNLVFVPGYYGGQVPTTVSFQQYIKD
ncbi:MAG: 6-hydroxymethylpterin diphosphokinase MptE-like protein, partial [bacterium]